jgi:hypothetical protein
MDFLQVNLGNLLTILTFVLGGIGFVYTIRSDVRIITNRLDTVETDLHELRKVVVELARQEERMSALDQRLLATGIRLDQIVIRLDGVINRERDRASAKESN